MKPFSTYSHIPNNGVVAYDCGLGKKVMVTSQVLSFQADLPMHAKVTNTFVPNVSLNPCRMCSLNLASINNKRKQKYVRDFLHINDLGEHVGLIIFPGDTLQTDECSDT
jgi:hypothetical protein